MVGELVSYTCSWDLQIMSGTYCPANETSDEIMTRLKDRMVKCALYISDSYIRSVHRVTRNVTCPVLVWKKKTF